ncbi:hypothetical protein, partial [Pseudonocardia acaciae]|uniref:hypothetical protein n=1 Tax=Pseudonocardia acaciae TaxID=551276 RepID=UPI00056BF01C
GNPVIVIPARVARLIDQLIALDPAFADWWNRLLRHEHDFHLGEHPEHDGHHHDNHAAALVAELRAAATGFGLVRPAGPLAAARPAKAPSRVRGWVGGLSRRADPHADAARIHRLLTDGHHRGWMRVAELADELGFSPERVLAAAGAHPLLVAATAPGRPFVAALGPAPSRHGFVPGTHRGRPELTLAGDGGVLVLGGRLNRMRGRGELGNLLWRLERQAAEFLLDPAPGAIYRVLAQGWQAGAAPVATAGDLALYRFEFDRPVAALPGTAETTTETTTALDVLTWSAGPGRRMVLSVYPVRPDAPHGPIFDTAGADPTTATVRVVTSTDKHASGVVARAARPVPGGWRVRVLGARHTVAGLRPEQVLVNGFPARSWIEDGPADLALIEVEIPASAGLAEVFGRQVGVRADPVRVGEPLGLFSFPSRLAVAVQAPVWAVADGLLGVATVAGPGGMSGGWLIDEQGRLAGIGSYASNRDALLYAVDNTRVSAFLERANAALDGGAVADGVSDAHLAVFAEVARELLPNARPLGRGELPFSSRAPPVKVLSAKRVRAALIDKGLTEAEAQHLIDGLVAFGWKDGAVVMLDNRVAELAAIAAWLPAGWFDALLDHEQGHLDGHWDTAGTTAHDHDAQPLVNGWRAAQNARNQANTPRQRSRDDLREAVRLADEALAAAGNTAAARADRDRAVKDA